MRIARVMWGAAALTLGLAGCTQGDEELSGPQSSWPTDPVTNYSVAYGIDSVQSVGIDDGHNLWVLDGNRIGFLTSEAGSVKWGSDLGQAGAGFESTVVCGGAAGKAYVGYAAEEDGTGVEMPSKDDPRYQWGDVDIVQADNHGVSLFSHLGKTIDDSGQIAGYEDLGIRNTNSWKFDEDRTVLTCIKSYVGASKGDVFIGTNHGVTRIRGDVYNSHLHPVWYDDGSMRAGYTFALGIAPDGDVLIGNDWMIGRVTPRPELVGWDDNGSSGATPFRIVTHVPEVNDLAAFDRWRGIAETTETFQVNGRRARFMYAGNVRDRDESYPVGLFRFTVVDREGTHLLDIAETERVFDKPVTAMAATDDGSLFFGTEADGLYRMKPDRTIERFSAVTGLEVRQLVYDPSQTPSMLLVLTDSGLFGVRGF